MVGPATGDISCDAEPSISKTSLATGVTQVPFGMIPAVGVMVITGRNLVVAVWPAGPQSSLASATDADAADPVKTIVPYGVA
jgi:hypothetical protein